jgi:predicted choloylglycine hydrolase
MNQVTQIDTDLFFFETVGSSDQIGRRYGHALKQQIAQQVERSVTRLRERYPEPKIAAVIDQVSATFQDNYPYLWDEIVGICSGSAISLRDYCWHLFMSALPVFEGEDNGCTDILFPKSDDGPLLGKTHDATTPKRAPSVVRASYPLDRHAVLCATSVDGLSTMTGVNAKGLAIGEASIHFHTSNRQGTVRNLLPRAILHECADVQEAVDFLAEHPPLRFGYHFALVDVNGQTAVVERSPTEQNVRWGETEVLFCTNHTASPEMRALERSRGELGDRNSDTRFANLQKIVADSQFQPSLEGMKELLRFHHDYGGICQHGDPSYKGPKLEFYPMHTQRAYINIVTSKQLLIANGNPCTVPFHLFNLKETIDQ